MAILSSKRSQILSPPPWRALLRSSLLTTTFCLCSSKLASADFCFAKHTIALFVSLFVSDSKYLFQQSILPKPVALNGSAPPWEVDPLKLASAVNLWSWPSHFGFDTVGVLGPLRLLTLIFGPGQALGVNQYLTYNILTWGKRVGQHKGFNDKGGGVLE